MNQLQVNQQQNIVHLHQRGWSQRKIARELGLDRGTVRKYVERSKPATQAQTGSDPAEGSKPAIPQTGSGGAKSKCEPFAQSITRDWKAGLSIQRILQDLRTETDFKGSYHSVRRFVLSLGESEAPCRSISVRARGWSMRTASVAGPIYSGRS